MNTTQPAAANDKTAEDSMRELDELLDGVLAGDPKHEAALITALGQIAKVMEIGAKNPNFEPSWIDEKRIAVQKAVKCSPYMASLGIIAHDGDVDSAIADIKELLRMKTESKTGKLMYDNRL